MEPRKIIKFGKSSYVVSIPKEWMEEHNIKKGDSIFLDRTPEGELILSAKEKENTQEPKKVTMDIEKRNFWAIKRELNFFYIDNFDLIILKGNHQDKEKIENLVKKLIGLQIVENSIDLMIIKNVLDLSNITTQDVFRRADNLIRSMFLELRECLNQNNRCSEKIKIIYNTDLEVNALYFLLMKIIRKAFKDRNYAAKIGKDALELNYLHHSILNVEIIGDHIKRIAKSIPSARLKSKNIQDICLILELIEKSYKDTMTAHYTNNQEIARRVAEETREIKEKAEQLATGTKNSDIGGMSEHFKEIASRLHFISKILAY